MNKKGVFLVLLQVLMGVIGVVFVKCLSDVGALEKTTIRTIVMIVVSSTIMYKNKISFRTQNHKLLIQMTVIGLMAVGAYFMGVTKIDIVQVSIIEQLTPIAIIITSVIFLKEKIAKEKLIFIALTLLGAIIAINPASVDFNKYSIFILVDVVCTGGIIVVLRRLMVCKENSMRIIFYYGIYSMIILIPMSIVLGFKVGSLENLVLLVLIGVCFTAKQLLSAESLKYLEANQACIIRYSEIVFAIIFGSIIFGERLNVNSAIGSVIIIMGILIDYKLENRKKCVIEIKH